MSDETIRSLERELLRAGVDPKDTAATILGTERGRYFGITTLPVNKTSFEVDMNVLSAPSQRMWATPLDRVETVIEIVRLGVEGLEGPPSFECVCTIYDDKRKLAVGDLNVGWRRAQWRASMMRRETRRESGSADFRDNDASPLS